MLTKRLIAQALRLSYRDRIELACIMFDTDSSEEDNLGNIVIHTACQLTDGKVRKISSARLRLIDIPLSHPVRPLRKWQKAKDRVQCGTCLLSWDDGYATDWTPTPAGRCPFEDYHKP